MSGNIVLKMTNISKTFPGVRALSNVDFTLREGEIHALMGENGAGKSTLIKVLTGVHGFEEGQIVMITSALCDDYEKGSDGYCLMVDKRPSITPLNVDMTRDVAIVEKCRKIKGCGSLKRDFYTGFIPEN